MDYERYCDYLDRQVERSNISRDTRRAYAGGVRRFREWLQPHPTHEPTIEEMQDYLMASAVGDATGTEKKGGSLNVEKCALRKYLYMTGRAGEYEDLKAWFSEHFTTRSQAEPDHFTDAEVDAIRAAAKQGTASERDRALVAILLETGIRVGEAIRLGRDDVTFNPSLGVEEDPPAALRIDRQKRETVVTDKRPLSATAAEAVEAYIDTIPEYVTPEAAGSSGLFITSTRTPLDTPELPGRLSADGSDTDHGEYTYRVTRSGIEYWLDTLAKRTDHPDVTPARMHPHLFRHTVGTRLGEAGYSAEQVGAFLGRASGAGEYIHLEDSEAVFDMAGAAP